MAHNHSFSPTNYGKAFAIGVALNLAFVLVEFVYGRLAHSLALVAARERVRSESAASPG